MFFVVKFYSQTLKLQGAPRQPEPEPPLARPWGRYAEDCTHRLIPGDYGESF